MIGISAFFDKFKNAALKETAVRQNVLDAIVKNIAHDGLSSDEIGLSLKDIEIRHKIIRIRAGSALKNQVFMKKESILSDIRKKNPENVFTDVR